MPRTRFTRSVALGVVSVGSAARTWFVGRVCVSLWLWPGVRLALALWPGVRRQPGSPAGRVCCSAQALGQVRRRFAAVHAKKLTPHNPPPLNLTAAVAAHASRTGALHCAEVRGTGLAAGRTCRSADPHGEITIRLGPGRLTLTPAFSSVLLLSSCVWTRSAFAPVAAKPRPRRRLLPPTMPLGPRWPGSALLSGFGGRPCGCASSFCCGWCCGCC